MNPEMLLEVKTLESALAPIAPTKSASRIWRIVGLVVAFQFLVIIAVVVLFSGLGLANEGVGSCGGG
jgi:type IV secretory pathway component VirB8